MQIKDLKVKEVVTLTVMIKSVNVGRTTAQKPYLKFEFVDQTGSVFANKWSVKPDELELFQAGQVVTVKGLVQLYNTQKQINIEAVSLVEGEVDYSQYVESSRFEKEALKASLSTFLDEMNPGYYREIVNYFLNKYEEEFYDQGDYYNSFMYKDNTAMIIAIVFAVIGLIGAVVVVLIVAYTRGRVDFQFNDHIPLNHEPPMFRDIPCQKDLFQFYYYAKKLGLITDQDRDGLIAAILLRWIKENYIEFQKEEVKQFLFFKKEGYSIDLDNDIPITHPLEKKLFQFFRQAAGSNQVLETDEFESWCKENYEKIDEWFESIDEYIENELREQHLLTLETTYTSFLKIRFSHSTDTYDASIREEMEHVIGLKTFLEEMSLIDEKEVIEVKLWEEYLIFASILQIADKVQEQLGRLCPTFNEQSQLDTIYTMHMVHMFSHNSMKASHDASIAASGGGGSSSFTGGGGGFSGGGGGGVR